MAKQLCLIALLFCTFIAIFGSNAAEASSVGVLRADQSPAVIIPKRLTTRICGYYCGPSWCANQVMDETKCVATGTWGMAAESGEVVDGCCRTHDDCCGKGVDRPTCNHAIVACIQANKAYWSFCGAAVWAAMKVVSGWCCGSKCPTFTDPEVPLTLAGKVFTDSAVRITFTDESHYVVEAVVKEEGEGGQLRLAGPSADASSCPEQTYALGAESLQLNLGPMMAVDTNACGKKLMAVSPSHDVHPLLDSPDTVLYWPHADVIAVNTKLGGVHKLERAN